jgi:uncharacterized protein (DUF58 family)
MGSVTFTGTDGQLVEVDTDDRKARDAYREAWNHRRKLLSALANRMNIIMLPIRTDQDIHASLIASLEQRARSRAV